MGITHKPAAIRASVVFLFSLLVLSCASLSPVSSPPASPPRVETPGDIVPHWLPFAEERVRGLAYFAGSVREPRLELRALRVDLREPALKIVVSGAEPVQGIFREGVIPSVKVTGFVRRYGCLAGINANPFDSVSGREGEAQTVVGITVSGGTLVSPPHPPFDALVFYSGASPGVRAAIVNQADLAGRGIENVENAVGGFFRVLEKGLVPGAVSRRTVRHPRSAAGLSADGNTLYLLVVDGRRPGSIGATEAELGIILKRLGALNGLNFDGGGSTVLALRYPGGRVRAANTPIHLGIPGQERAVATCLGIGIRE
jgi:hypothetical protein